MEEIYGRKLTRTRTKRWKRPAKILHEIEAVNRGFLNCKAVNFLNKLFWFWANYRNNFYANLKFFNIFSFDLKFEILARFEIFDNHVMTSYKHVICQNIISRESHSGQTQEQIDQKFFTKNPKNMDLFKTNHFVEKS